MKYKFALPDLEKLLHSELLTDREHEVFKLYYIRGWAIENVAAEINVSRKTIDNILKNIREKAKYILGEKTFAKYSLYLS